MNRRKKTALKFALKSFFVFVVSFGVAFAFVEGAYALFLWLGLPSELSIIATIVMCAVMWAFYVGYLEYRRRA